MTKTKPPECKHLNIRYRYKNGDFECDDCGQQVKVNKPQQTDTMEEKIMIEWEKELEKYGLKDWKVEISTGGALTMFKNKTIYLLPKHGMVMFLHEVAHALTKQGHNAIWGDKFTELVTDLLAEKCRPEILDLKGKTIDCIMTNQTKPEKQKLYEPKMTLKDVVMELAIMISQTNPGFEERITDFLIEMNAWGKPESLFTDKPL